MNKKTVIFPLIVTILAVIAAAGVKTFLGPCVHEDGTFGVCHWAGQALFGTALLISMQGLAALCLKSYGMRQGLLFAMTLSAVLGICIPGGLIGLCGMETMRCRALMRPAMTILFVLMGIVSAAGCVKNRDRQNPSGTGQENRQ